MKLFKNILSSVKASIDSSSIEREIHNDVFSAQELLLAEANKILGNKSEFDSEKSKRLKELGQLGFQKFDEYQKFAIEEREQRKQQEIKDLITHYSTNYPLNKFITEDIVKKICKKYGLLLASVSDYKAEIPEKNQIEIVNFRIKESDIRRYYYGFNRNDISYEHYLEERMKHKDDMMKCTDIKIIAPAHKLDMTNREVKGYKLEIKDPIVLQPVNGGYLIVSSWGLEASDEDVVNPNKN